MFEPDYMLFCAGKSTDERGNLSIHGIFDAVYAENFPVQHRPFIVVFRFKAKKAFINGDLGLKLVVEKDGKEVNKLEAKGKATVEKGKALTPSFDIGQFVFPEAGDYDFKLYLGNKLMDSRVLEVHSASELVEP